MFDKASLKLGLDKAVLQSMGTKDMVNVSILSRHRVVILLRMVNIGHLGEFLRHAFI